MPAQDTRTRSQFVKLIRHAFLALDNNITYSLFDPRQKHQNMPRCLQSPLYFQQKQICHGGSHFKQKEGQPGKKLRDQNDDTTPRLGIMSAKATRNFTQRSQYVICI